MRVGSLFAGIGGFDLAAERVGMEVVWQSEIDPKASAVLDHHWPHIKNLGDIHGIRINDGVPVGPGKRSGESGHRGGTITDAAGRNHPGDMEATQCDTRGSQGSLPAVDVLTGGFPCQDYSVAGTRGGLAGDRGALWWEYHRLIAGLRPTWVIGENVPGLLSSRGGRDFETIVGSLTELGYGVAWAVLDAQYFGVAQRRRRVFIVGHSGGEPRPEVLALGEGVFGHPEPSRKAGERITQSLTASAFGGGGPDDKNAFNNQLVASPSGFSNYEINDRAGTLRQTLHKGEASPLAFHWQSGGDTLSAREDYTDSLLASQVPAVAFAQNQRDEVRDLGDKAGALAAEQTYVAKTAFSGASVRRLTPLECERLQGFPDGWTATPGNSDTQRYRQLGNAVAVPVVEWLLRRVMEVDGV